MFDVYWHDSFQTDIFLPSVFLPFPSTQHTKQIKGFIVILITTAALSRSSLTISTFLFIVRILYIHVLVHIPWQPCGWSRAYELIVFTCCSLILVSLNFRWDTISPWLFLSFPMAWSCTGCVLTRWKFCNSLLSFIDVYIHIDVSLCVHIYIFALVAKCVALYIRDVLQRGS